MLMDMSDTINTQHSIIFVMCMIRKADETISVQSMIL